MSRESPPEPLARFLELYAANRFWASHEALEEEWFRTKSDFYRGLILYASVWVHWERRNAHGSRAQLGKALRCLHDYPSPYMGLDVDAIRAHCLEVRDAMVPGFDRWGDHRPMPLGFARERVRGDEPELAVDRASRVRGEARSRTSSSKRGGETARTAIGRWENEGGS